MSQVIILRAARGAGKTTACLRFAGLARAAGLRVGGITAPGEGDALGKSSIDALDLGSGQRRRLAVALQPGAEHSPPATVGRYRFDPAVTDWSLQVLLDALGRPLDAVVVDEVGRLELAGGGYAPVLARLYENPAAAHVILAVRDAFAEDVAARLAGLMVRTVVLRPENRDTVPDALLCLVASTCTP